MRAIKLQTYVSEDHTVKLQLPDDVREGPAEVIVLVPEAHRKTASSLSDFLTTLSSRPRRIRSKEEIDRDLAQERESWD
jgi:hypothetical protein